MVCATENRENRKVLSEELKDQKSQHVTNVTESGARLQVVRGGGEHSHREDDDVSS